MLPDNGTALITILLAVVPGFVATTTWARAKTWKGPTGDFRTMIESVALSAVIQLVMAPVTIAWIAPVRDRLDEFPERTALWFLLTVLVVPVSGGLVAGRLSDYLGDLKNVRVEGRLKRRIARVWPAPLAPSVWDWLFTVRPPNGSFVRITFKDGAVVAGVFAEGSIAFTSPEPHGLFLVSEWEADKDGNIIGPIPESRGIMIPDVTEIRDIRFLGEGNEQE